MSSNISGLNPMAYTGVESSTPPQFVMHNKVPTPNDFMNFNIGTIWLDTSSLRLAPPVLPTSDNLYMLVSKINHVGSWMSFGGGDVNSLTGDTGIVVDPDVAGNINIITGNAVVNSGSSVQFSSVPAPNTLQLNVTDILSNTIIGMNSGNAAITGNSNTSLGMGTLTNLTTGTNNVAIGITSLASLTTGNYNTAVGQRALTSITTTDYNTAVGASALFRLTTGLYNTALGAGVLDAVTTGSFNTGVGTLALAHATGNDNTGVGQSSLFSLTTGINNTALGSGSLLVLLSGNDNTAIGRTALAHATIGNNNTGVGSYSLYELTTGDNNTASGYQSGQSISTGNNNTLIGWNSGRLLTTTSNNTSLGSAALVNCIGSNNTSIGYGSGATFTTGSYNVILGDLAGVSLTVADSSNIIIGQSAFAGDSHRIRIGAQGGGDGQQNQAYVAGITATPTIGVGAEVVLVDANGQLGTTTPGTATLNNGVNQIDISNDAAATTVNIGTGGASKQVTVGSIIVASSLDLRYGGNNFSLASGVGNAMTARFSGEINYPLQPAFSAWNTIDRLNVTGDGTVYTMIFDTEIFDQNNDFDGISTFTAPVAGKYYFSLNTTLRDLGAAHNKMAIHITTTTREYHGGQLNPGVCKDASILNMLSLSFGTFADMAIGDTAIFTVHVDSGLKTVGVVGTVAGCPANCPHTFVQGWLVC